MNQAMDDSPENSTIGSETERFLSLTLRFKFCRPWACRRRFARPSLLIATLHPVDCGNNKIV